MQDNHELAINGGQKMRQTDFAPWPFFGQDEIQAVTDVIGSGRVNYWTGQEGRLFEQEFAKHVDCAYGVAVANGTVALELCLYALGIGPGDEVIIPSRTFIATASAVALRGATPKIADIDLISQNISVETIKPELTPRTKALIVVHLAGWPCDMDPIVAFAREHGLSIIEDCAQAHGARYKERPVGSLGDIAAFSFCQDKIMTTGGEGGMVTTDSERLWERAWSYKDHGKNYHTIRNIQQNSGFRWIHDDFGTNWRLAEMQSAIGRVVLKKLPQWVEARRRNASILTEGFSQIPLLRVTAPPEHAYHSYYKYYAFIRSGHLRRGWNRDRVISAINAEGIPCFSGTCSEIYLEKAFKKNGLDLRERLSNAKMLGEVSLMFLVHPTLSEEDMRDTCRAVAKVMIAAEHRSAA